MGGRVEDDDRSTSQNAFDASSVYARMTGRKEGSEDARDLLAVLLARDGDDGDFFDRVVLEERVLDDDGRDILARADDLTRNGCSVLGIVR